MILFFYLFCSQFTFSAELTKAEDIKALINSLPTLNTEQNKKDSVSNSYDLILIDFWASWCEPCKESFPYYEKLINENKNKKIKFIGINLDDEQSSAKDFLKDKISTHEMKWDEKKKTMDAFNVDAIPVLLVLDKNWNKIELIKGFNQKSKEKLHKILKQK